MDVCFIGLGILLGVAAAHIVSELKECLNGRQLRKRLKANEEKFKFKEEIRTMVIGITDRKIKMLQDEVIAYINNKLAAADKQEESREEDKHE